MIGGWPDEPDEHTRVALRVDLALGAERTPIPVVQVRVRHGDVRARRRTRRRACRPWPRRRGARRGRGRIGGRRLVRTSAASSSRRRRRGASTSRVFSVVRAQEQLPEAGERRPLLVEELRHVAQGVDRGFQGRVLVLGERRMPRPVDQAFEIVHAQIDRGIVGAILAGR